MTEDSLPGMLCSGALAPAIVSCGVVWLAGRCLSEEMFARCAAAWGFVAGFVAGYALQPDWASLTPERHWHWIPYLAVVAGILGPVTLRQSVSQLGRWLVLLLLSSAAAWFLVPMWASLEPSRTFWMLLLSGVMLVTAAGLTPLMNQPEGQRQQGVMLAVASLVVTLMIAACVSLTYARIASGATAALAGVCLAHWWSRSRVDLRGLLPAYAVVVGGIAFVGCIEPQPAVFSLLALPAAPLGLWITRIGLLPRLSGVRAGLLKVAAVGVPLLLASVLAYRGV